MGHDDFKTDVIHTGDAFDVLAELPAESVHACVTDPPYGLAFMGRDWDDFEPKEYQEWCEEWAREVKRVLKPGGHLLAFSGNRTHHRLFSGVEDAGFEVRDTITWHYGSGFPKALDVSKAIDKMGGNPELSDVVGDELKKARERRDLSIPEADELFCDGTSNYSWFEGRPRGQRIPPDETFKEIAEEWPELQELFEKVSSVDREVIRTKEDNGDRTVEILNGDGEYEVTLPATDAAEKWDGFKTALKPATEYVVVARKPLSEGTVAENVQTHGTGALNIDGTRINTDDELEYTVTNQRGGHVGGDNSRQSEPRSPEGRYPSNVVFDRTEAERLDRENEHTSGTVRRGKDGGFGDGNVYGDDDHDGLDPERGFDDSGGPSRYFYTSKASKAERTLDGAIDNAHPTVKPADLMEWLVTLVTAEGQTVLDPFAGSGTTCRAAKDLGREFVGIERQAKWADVARVRVGLTPDDPSVVRDDDAQSGVEEWT